MSCIENGVFLPALQTSNSFGGTDKMGRLFIKNIPKHFYDNCQIHVGKLTENINFNKKQILWVHDHHLDEHTPILSYNWDHYVFVSSWQRDQFVGRYQIPYSKISVIENVIDFIPQKTNKPKESINLVYSSVPDRGLDILYDVFCKLDKEIDNLFLTIYSSFQLYGWSDFDKSFLTLFEKLSNHKKINFKRFVDSHDAVLGSKYNSHLFVYPCTWWENSCISLIESIACGCICIHPNIGALPETSAGRSITYDFTENKDEHVQRCYDITRSTILKLQNNEEILPNNYQLVLYKHTLSHFKNKWIDLLNSINNKKNNLHYM